MFDIAIFVNPPKQNKAMKSKMFYLLFFIIALGHGQVISIPDTNLKNVLLTANGGNGIALDSSDDAIVIDANADGEIEQDEAEEVRSLYISGYSISNLTGIEYFTNLRTLDCSQNGIATFDASLNSDLRYLYCSQNVLTSLTISGLDHLLELDCQGNNIMDLDFAGLEYLTTVNCSDNQLTSLDFSGCPALVDFSCAHNSIITINIKNGALQGAVYGQNYWNNNPLEYICIDDAEIDTVNNLLAQNSYMGINVNTFCSFTPGGDYNTITGGLIFDADNNGCGPGDAPHCFVKLALSDGVTTSYTFTDEMGAYDFYTQNGNFTVAPDFENESFYTASPPSSGNIPFLLIDNSVATQDFCVTANGAYNDVEVVMMPFSKAVPGMSASYKIVYKNKGNTTIAAGSVSCVWDTDIVASYSNFSPLPNIMAQDLYSWNFSDLKPFESREINMTFVLNSNAVTPPINVGDIVPFVAAANIGTGNPDNSPEDNSFTFNQKIEAAYQANYILCIEGDTAPVSNIGDYLHYVINFTNTGTETASNVVITQVFDPAQFDLSTLEILNTSHSTVARVSGNTARFMMEGANVVDGNGHGDILFKLKSKHNLAPNTAVTGQATINFDYRAPQQTNMATTVYQTLNADGFEKDLSVVLYPNPVVNVVKVTADNTIRSIELYDVQGRLLQTDIVNNATAAEISLLSRASGLYFVKVITEKGIKVEKLVKQ